MNREHEAAAAAASQLTEQLAVQQLAAKQALKQVSCLRGSTMLCLHVVEKFYFLGSSLEDIANLTGPPSTSSHVMLAQAHSTTFCILRA